MRKFSEALDEYIVLRINEASCNDYGRDGYNRMDEVRKELDAMLPTSVDEGEEL